MFWSNPVKDDSGSTDSETSDEFEERRWGVRSRDSGKKSKRYYESKKQKGLFSAFAWPWSNPKHSKNKRSKKKERRRFSFKGWRAQSSQQYGLVFLLFLLLIYVFDFVNLLNRDNRVKTLPKISHSVFTENSTTLQKNESSAVVQQVLAQHDTAESGSRADTHHMSENPHANTTEKENTQLQNNTVQQPSTATENAPVSPAIPVTDSTTGNIDRKTDESTSVNAQSSEGPLQKHPMNNNILELQVPEKTGILSPEEIKGYYRTLAKAYIKTFVNGIYRQMFFDVLRRRTYSLTPPGANKGAQTILFQIIDKKVYMLDPYEVPRNSKPFYRTRINQVIWLLSKLASEGRIKNTEFLMAIHDCVQTVNKHHTYRGANFQESNPAFTIVSCNFSDNIPFPMWEGSKHRDGGFSEWDQTMREYAADEIPWEQKQDRAVFRGGNRPSMYFKNKTDANSFCDSVGRTRLQYLSRQQPDVLDVSIGGTCGGTHSTLERLQPKDHHKFKYILYAEGNCMWADRSRHQVFGPSMIIKQQTPCGQFFEPLLKPEVHYIPTDFFFTDTIQKIMWAREHDSKAADIVKNANEFAKNFLTLSGIEHYVEVLLQEYTALLVDPDIKLENGAIDVTDKKV